MRGYTVEIGRGYGHRANYSDVMETPEDIIIEEEPAKNAAAMLKSLEEIEKRLRDKE